MITDEKLARELEAQKKRVTALKYLATQGQNVDSAEKVIQDMRTSSQQSDNTLELLLKQKAKTADPRELEKKAKAALLASQEAVRASSLARENLSSLPSSNVKCDWEELQDEVSNRKYYWNKVTNTTQWEKPPEFEVSRFPSESRPRTIQIGEAIWESCIHPATNQEYWVNKKTGEKKFEVPTVVAKASSEPISEGKTTEPSKGQKRKLASVDPLDPTYGRDGDRFGEAKDGRMADSTAGGALWQQRPYPAPSKVILAKKKADSLVGPIFQQRK